VIHPLACIFREATRLIRCVVFFLVLIADLKASWLGFIQITTATPPPRAVFLIRHAPCEYEPNTLLAPQPTPRLGMCVLPIGHAYTWRSVQFF
jgi:hypothetical protein